MAMLEGAVEVLARVRPRLVIEVKPTNVRAASAILRAHDYLMFDGESEDFVERACCAYETIAIPREKAGHWLRVGSPGP